MVSLCIPDNYVYIDLKNSLTSFSFNLSINKDIPYGLLLAKWVAEQLNVKTPFIDEIIMWAQNLRNEHWLNDDHSIDMNFCMTHKQLTGLPPSYGINNVDDILD